jgi:hypothetical protein
VTRLGRSKRQTARAGAAFLFVLGLSPLVLVVAAGKASATDPAPPPSSSAALPRSVVLRPLAPAPTVSLTRTPPDPPAIVEKSQWVYDLRYSQGELYLLGIHRLELPAPQATPRAMGRFSLELYEGTTLLERARFDFPMLGDNAAVPVHSSPDASTELPIGGRPVQLSKITTRVGVMFPASPRGTRIEIVDRALDRRWPLPWPPTEMTSTASDAGAFDGGPL